MAKVKWAVWGSCGIAKRRTVPEGILPAENAELVCAYDVDAKANQAVSTEWAVKAAATEEELLASPAQAVYIGTPAYLHLPHALACLKAGKHVLLEKPLAHTRADAEAIAQAVKTAAGKGVYFTEGYMMKFHPLHAHAAMLVRSGKLGKPVFARAQLSCWYPPMPGAWRQDPATGGGGSLMDMGTHCIDLLMDFFGPVRSVYARVGHLVHKYASEDSATVLLEFANGAHAVVEAFFNVPDAGVPRRLEVYGSAGVILADGTIGQGGGTMQVCLSDPTAVYDAKQARRQEGFQPVEPGEFNMYRSEIEYLSRCILHREEPKINTAQTGLKVLEVTWAAYESAKTNQAVMVG